MSLLFKKKKKFVQNINKKNYVNLSDEHFLDMHKLSDNNNC